MPPLAKKYTRCKNKKTNKKKNKKHTEDLVREGNELLGQQKIEEAIDKYDQAIEKRPYYAIAHYNKRIAHDIPSNSAENDVDKLNNWLKDLKLASDTYFVISTVAAVPELEFSEDSSDEEPDEEFNKLFNNNDFPFTTTKQRQNEKEQKRKKSQTLDRKSPDRKQRSDSAVKGPFLSNVSKNGFAEKEKPKLSTIAVSMLLNRMYSLSTRKNMSLILELKSKVSTTGIKYERVGYHWECAWYWRNGEKANFEDVRSFYKKLKRRDRSSAKKFIEQEENEGAERNNVPYRELREYAKNHPKTEKLIKAFRDKDRNSNIYLHLVDADVHDFNGVYSAYLRIIHGCCETPTVMSTGYQFPKDELSTASQLLGERERMHRVITTFYIPFGTYYPEPNMCILIPKDRETVEESFIDSERGKGRTFESPIILANIQEKRKKEGQSVFAIFSEDSPIITRIPERFEVSFSSEYKGHASPTRKDVTKYNKVPQSHTHNLTWSRGLFRDHSIKNYNNNYKIGENNEHGKNVPYHYFCLKLITAIRKNEDQETSKIELVKRIGDDNTKNIVAAIETINRYNDEFSRCHLRTPQEEKLLLESEEEYMSPYEIEEYEHSDVQVSPIDDLE